MIEVEVSNGVAEIGLPEAGLLTRHSVAAAQELTEALHACNDRDDIKAIILHNDGGDFCVVENDDTAISSPIVWTQWQPFFAGPGGLYQSLCFSRKVTTAAVDGSCTGAGTLLALCSDTCIASAAARFGSPFRQLPEASLALAALTMGLNRAKAWALMDSELTATEAFHQGLVNAVSSEPALVMARRVASSVVRLPLDGIAMSKLLVEGLLDTQGVAQEFDAAALAAASMPQIGEGMDR